MVTENVLDKILSLAAVGRWPEARKIYRRVLKTNPKDWNLLYKIGILEAKAENYPVAITILEKAKKIDPKNSQINVNLAQLYALNDQPSKAWPILQDLRQKVGDSEPFYRQLGGVAQKLQKYEEAEDSYRKALDLGSKDVELLNNYAVLLQGYGRSVEAVQLLERAFAEDSTSTAIANNLANLCIIFGRMDRALAMFNDALTRNPENVSINRNLALLHRSLGDPKRALDAAQRAAILDPQNVDSLTISAELLERRAELDRAAQLLEFCLIGSPDNIDAISLKARSLRRVGKIDSSIKFLEENLLRLGEMPNTYKINFELGHAYQAQGNYNEAFPIFNRANKLQEQDSEEKNIEPSRAFTRLRDLKSILSRIEIDEAPKNSAVDGHDDPVFMVGFPRSGTTLLDQVLDSHPGVVVLEERPLVAGMIRRLASDDFRYPQDLAQLNSRMIQKLRSGYFQDRMQFIEVEAGEVFVDKMPLNINEAILINSVFPKARFIVVIRDPCDVCLSCFTQAFELNDWMAVFNDIAATAKLYNEVFDLWYETVSKFNIEYHEVRYEDLVNDLQGTASKILKFLDLSWDNKMARHDEHARNRGYLATPSHAQVTQPVYQHAVQRWKLYGGHMKEVEKLLQTKRRQLGYSTTGQKD
ncbi:MAG: hypothetical protein CMM58_02450 [Rhodospirillaceae bacterium]|nr:hypothetical protein [Rhodospirillaceae bacterium]|tara:strand:+ start:3129 stop:5057 length:1929 start_codon:yes stop_codon:yes gene_type:complete